MLSLGASLSCPSHTMNTRFWILRWHHMSAIAGVERTPCWLTLADQECYTTQRQSRDSNHDAMNAGSMRTKFCVLGGDVTANER